jgi:hypothetical protein
MTEDYVVMWEPSPYRPGEFEEFGRYATPADAISYLLSGAPLGVNVSAELRGDGRYYLLISQPESVLPADPERGDGRTRCGEAFSRPSSPGANDVPRRRSPDRSPP